MSLQYCSDRQKKFYSDVQVTTKNYLFNTCHQQKTIFEQTDDWPEDMNFSYRTSENETAEVFGLSNRHCACTSR
jgi:hypothetical protein